MERSPLFERRVNKSELRYQKTEKPKTYEECDPTIVSYRKDELEVHNNS